MTEKEWAEKLNGREYGKELTQQEEKQMKQDGVVAVYGAGQDICRFNGAINDVFYDDEDVRVNTKGIVICNPDEQLDSSEFKRIQAIWHYEGNPYWTIETDIQYETFDVYDSEEEKLFCKGIVFKLTDYKKPLTSMTNFEKIKAMSVEEMAAFIGKKPFCALEQGDVDCVYGWHDSDCRKHAKCWLESEVNQNEENA